MPTALDNRKSNDSFDLNRFTIAQQSVYPHVLKELGNGQKRTHWMWYIFPQLAGLGHSPTSKRYAISGPEEAQQYLSHHVLGARLVECAEAVLATENKSASDIFGYPDDRKLKSSMTLFASVIESHSAYNLVLTKFFRGERDEVTLALLDEKRSN